MEFHFRKEGKQQLFIKNLSGQTRCSVSWETPILLKEATLVTADMLKV